MFFYTALGRVAFVGLLMFLFFNAGCSVNRPAMLQSRNIATPFPEGSKATCSSLRKDLLLLRSELRNGVLIEHDRSAILARLSLQNHPKNLKNVSTPREKMDLLIMNELLITEKGVWEFIKAVDELDIIGIVCRDLEETISPGFGEGIAHADFHRVGEDYLAYLVFNKEDRIYLVFAPNSGPVDTRDRETVLSLIGHASKAAVHEGVKAVIP